MIFKSENHVRFDRENKILYEVILNRGVEESVALFVFEQYFPDKTNLPKSAIKYLNDYMLQYPTLWKEAAKTKYQLADFVKNRCVNQRQEIGIVIKIHEQNGYYNVRFGPEQNDIELKHAEEIIEI